jgi:DNA-binding CsgD family transcriptional regulator
MAQTLKLTEATVRSHMGQIYKRLGVKNRTQASTRYMLWTQQNGLFDDG